jgi:glycosyl transferase family 87
VAGDVTNGVAKPARPFWTVHYKEARGHATLCAFLLWTSAIVFAATGHGYRSIAGPLKGADFVHFYTLGHLAVAGRIDQLYDADAQYDLQTTLVPESKGDRFLPVYPPQTALLFAPFSIWSYGTSALLWALTTIVLYAWIVRATWKRSWAAVPDGTFVLLAAAAFPPFWNLVLFGQTTLLPLLAFYLGWRALERRHPYWAGLAFGLLAFKPQFGLVLAAVVLACGEWAILAGALSSVMIQAGVVVLAMEPRVFWDLLAAVRSLPQITPMLEPKAQDMHSIRAVTGLLPAWAAAPAWLGVSLAVCYRAIRTWRTNAPVAVRVGVLVLASVLVNPHLTIYDATVLVLPLLWIGGWIETGEAKDLDLRQVFWPAVYWLFVAFLVPIALLIKVQCSVFLMLWMFYRVSALDMAGRPVAQAALRRPTLMAARVHVHRMPQEPCEDCG